LVVFLLDFSKGDTGSSLVMDQLAESCLSLNEGIGDSLLSAQSRQESDQFNWVNIVGDDYKLGLVQFNQFGHVVKSELDVDWLGSLELGFSLLCLVVLLGIFLTFAGFSFFQESLLLFFMGLGSVLCK